MRTIIRRVLPVVLILGLIFVVFMAGRATVPTITLAEDEVITNAKVFVYAYTAPALASDETSVEAQTYDCPGALAPRLAQGGTGWVDDNDPRPVNLRSEPGTDADKIGELPVGTEFYVLSGPTCQDGMNWYRVRNNDNGQTGSISEGTDFYFVSPLQ